MAMLTSGHDGVWGAAAIRQELWRGAWTVTRCKAAQAGVQVWGPRPARHTQVAASVLDNVKKLFLQL